MRKIRRCWDSVIWYCVTGSGFNPARAGWICFYRTGTPSGGFRPGIAVFDEFGPERKETALDGFDGVDAAAACIEKGALLRFATGLANAAHVAGAVKVEGFEIGLAEAEKTGGARDIVFCEVDITGDLAAFAAAGLAGEANFEIGGAAHATPA